MKAENESLMATEHGPRPQVDGGGGTHEGRNDAGGDGRRELLGGWTGDWVEKHTRGRMGAPCQQGEEGAPGPGGGQASLPGPSGLREIGTEVPEGLSFWIQ